MNEEFNRISEEKDEKSPKKNAWSKQGRDMRGSKTAASAERPKKKYGNNKAFKRAKATKA